MTPLLRRRSRNGLARPLTPASHDAMSARRPSEAPPHARPVCDQLACETVAVLEAGPIPPATKTLQVREGLWLSEMLPKIAEQTGIPIEQLQAVLDQNQIQPRYRPDGNTSWEGLLFPSTYQVDQNATALDVLAKMSNEFAKVTGQLGYGAAETKLNHSAYEVIIVASMVEAEAKTDVDRPRVARVIYNRLQKQQSLDIDATCIFEAQDRKVQLTDKFMKSGSPYDCRSNISLPPTPISFPSKASLQAAINPAEGDWLYYVVKDAQGNEFFTKDFDEFNKQIGQSLGLSAHTVRDHVSRMLAKADAKSRGELIARHVGRDLDPHPVRVRFLGDGDRRVAAAAGGDPVLLEHRGDLGRRRGAAGAGQARRQLRLQGRPLRLGRRVLQEARSDDAGRRSRPDRRDFALPRARPARA